MVNDRLVSNCSHVLSTLLEGELHVNQIIDKTGLHKDYVRDAIKELHVAKLISEKKHPKYAQRKMKMLTELGRELAS
jgi:DNA-binding HxlR family transcriptional regulator